MSIYDEAESHDRPQGESQIAVTSEKAMNDLILTRDEHGNLVNAETGQTIGRESPPSSSDSESSSASGSSELPVVLERSSSSPGSTAEADRSPTKDYPDVEEGHQVVSLDSPSIQDTIMLEPELVARTNNGNGDFSHRSRAAAADSYSPSTEGLNDRPGVRPGSSLRSMQSNERPQEENLYGNEGATTRTLDVFDKGDQMVTQFFNPLPTDEDGKDKQTQQDYKVSSRSPPRKRKKRWTCVS